MATFGPNTVTRQGFQLISKALAGRTGFNFSLFKAGDGRFTGNPETLTELVNFRLNGRIVGIREDDEFTELECIVDNRELTELMEFREIGIVADDPDLGQILFAYTNAGEYPAFIGPFSGTWLHEELFKIRVYTANVANITATITPTSFAREIAFDNTGSGLNATNIQDAIVEIIREGQLGSSGQYVELSTNAIPAEGTQLHFFALDEIDEIQPLITDAYVNSSASGIQPAVIDSGGSFQLPASLQKYVHN